MTLHQIEQIKIIDGLEHSINQNAVTSTTVAPVEDFVHDNRICLTVVHFPRPDLTNSIINDIIAPLQQIEPSFHYYDTTSLHITVKNIRTIEFPPLFTDQDVIKAQAVLSSTIPGHQKFNVFFNRLLLFPHSISLVGTTDPELDPLVIDLDNALKTAGLPDNKTYVNNSHFFCNMTLARFGKAPSESFKEKIVSLSKHINLDPYCVDDVSLITANAVLTTQKVINTWKLQ